MDFSKFLSAIKVPTYVLAGVAGASGAALLLPASVVSTLGIAPLVSAHRPWIGAAFLLSTALFLTSIASKAWKTVSPALVQRWNVRQSRASLHHLSPPERKILREYIRADTTTRIYSYSDGVVAGLEGKGILYRASTLGSPLAEFPYNLQPWAWEYLRAHPEILEESKASGSSRAG